MGRGVIAHETRKHRDLQTGLNSEEFKIQPLRRGRKAREGVIQIARKTW